VPDVFPLVPTLDLDLHFILCDFGAPGTAYVETVSTEVDRDAIIRNMMSGEYDHPLHFDCCNGNPLGVRRPLFTPAGSE
jgi:hypothetical protein